MPELRRNLEAVLFAAGRPLDLPTLVAAVSQEQALTPAAVAQALAEIEQAFPADGPHGFELGRVGEGWVFRTNRLAEPALSAFFDLPEDPRLSPAALETLAIVAYLQPVTRPELSECGASTATRRCRPCWIAVSSWRGAAVPSGGGHPLSDHRAVPPGLRPRLPAGPAVAGRVRGLS